MIMTLFYAKPLNNNGNVALIGSAHLWFCPKFNSGTSVSFGDITVLLILSTLLPIINLSVIVLSHGCPRVCIAPPRGAYVCLHCWVCQHFKCCALGVCTKAHNNIRYLMHKYLIDSLTFDLLYNNFSGIPRMINQFFVTKIMETF